MTAAAHSRLTRAQRDHRATALLGEAPNATATVAIGGTVLHQRCVVSVTRIRLFSAIFDRRGGQVSGSYRTRLLRVELDSGETVLDMRS